MAVIQPARDARLLAIAISGLFCAAGGALLALYARSASEQGGGWVATAGELWGAALAAGGALTAFGCAAFAASRRLDRKDDLWW